MSKDTFNLALKDWIYVATERLHSDNVNYSEMETITGMIYAIDVQLWSIWSKKFSIPVTLWDALKIKLFPFWLLKHFPAKIRTFTFSEVLPSLSKKDGTFQKQLEKNTVGEIESVIRKPTIGYESWPSSWEE